MTKVNLLKASVLLAAALCIGVSCNKDNNTTPTNPTNPSTKTPKEMLTGKWKITHEITDANSNNTPDDAEKVALDASKEYYYTFNADGSGLMEIKDSNIDTSFNITWALKDNDTKLNIVSPLDSPTNEIVSLTDTELLAWVNTDKPSEPRKWEIAAKQ